MKFFLLFGICLWSQISAEVDPPSSVPTATNRRVPTQYPVDSPKSYPLINFQPNSVTYYPTGGGPTNYTPNYKSTPPTAIATGGGPTNYTPKPPTAVPTGPGPTIPPTTYRTLKPTPHPTGPGPTIPPTTYPTLKPTSVPTGPGPTIPPTTYPTLKPTANPTLKPTANPTGPGPIAQPTSRPATAYPTGPGTIRQPTPYPTPYSTPEGPTPAPAGPTGSYPVGVQYNKTRVKAAIAYHSCVQCYSETYAKVTTTDDVENLCTGEWLFVAATGPFFLGAFGLRSEVMLRSDGHESNQVTWFHQPGHAIGFNVTYGGIYWPLNGLPGSRVGEFDNVVSSTYRKHIYSCPV